MSRSSDNAEEARAENPASRIFASNAALLIGAAFEIGMLLGRNTAKTPAGRKVRNSINDLADKLVELAPDAARLVPDLVPAKPRRRRTRK